jgi:hypothetical protein
MSLAHPNRVGEAASVTDNPGPANVWIFHGTGAPFASGVFASRADGMAWIARHRLTGILTEYPVGDGCYDIAVRNGHFTPSRPHHGTADHVARFSPGNTDHVHVRDGDEDHHYGDD